MLPGFRFLFAAIVLSMSVLVFGLGAAALLRAAHEQFASNPSWHAAPDATFALQAETTRPVLAMLRVEPPPAEQKASENVPAQAATLAAPTVSAPAEQAAIAPPSEPERVAALKPEEPAPPAVAKSRHGGPGKSGAKRCAGFRRNKGCDARFRQRNQGRVNDAARNRAGLAARGRGCPGCN